MPRDNPRPLDQARRNAIIKVLSGAAALLALAAGAYALSSWSPSPDDRSESTITIGSSTVSLASETSVQSGSPAGIDIRVVYFGMPTTATGTKKETLTLRNPAYLSDLKAALVRLHPTLKGMLPTMLFLVDGVAANGNPQLQNNIEVDILAQIAGG